MAASENIEGIMHAPSAEAMAAAEKEDAKTAKKAAKRKKAEPKVKAHFVLQYQGKEWDLSAAEECAKHVWTSKLGKKAGDLKELQVYLTALHA